MPRIPRKSTETTIFHVMTQGIDKSYIFSKTEDIKHYIKLMYKLKSEQNIKIIAYCIMNNHAHILIQTECIEDLSKYMQRLNTSYGKYYNKKYKRIGYVFRDRFKSEGIYNEDHLYNCINYIYNNPVKAGICKQASQYPYSNYKKIEVVNMGDYTFIEAYEKKKDCKDVLQEYLKKNKINMEKLGNEKAKLIEVIKILKDYYRYSFIEISKEINMNREKVRRIYYKQ